MKRIVALVLVLILALSVFAGCGSKEKDYTLSIGVVVTEGLAKNKITQTVAAVVTDAEGKIVACRLDCVDYTAKYTDGALDTKFPSSKVALGENYGSMPAGTWSVQGAALEEYVVGKTQTEVAAIAVDNSGKITDADLKASCSIAVTDLLKAIDNAFKSEHKVAFKASADALTAGLASVGTVKDSSKDASKNVKESATYAAVVLADGAVVAAILDTAEPELVGITDDGAASLNYKGTKREQGEKYDSYSPMPAGTWYVQADVYAATAVGKTASDIATLATEGVAGCTISVTAYKSAIEAAVKAAR